MSDTVIHVESLWKKYRLGLIGTGTLAHDLNRWWHRVLSKPDPYAIVGQTKGADLGRQKSQENAPDAKRSLGLQSQVGEEPLSCPPPLAEDEIWALRNAAFEVKRGEILGIIGRNGAGKSTLLKVLSRVTAPTAGEVRVKGRIASLLEVGTGFHPELTGRENIFLNGAILGMTKEEIKRKFDEIVAFAEVEKFIDTPVKRYSSGMYVRLAFAVAAHLDPEIMVVDEVLAVGDASFQKKCLGKMGDVAQGGRTVLFVSHNMTAVTTLCSRVILIENGRLVGNGDPHVLVPQYLGGEGASTWEVSWPNPVTAPGDRDVRLESVRVVPEQSSNSGECDVTTPLKIIVDYINHRPGSILNVSLVLNTRSDICVLNTGSDPAPHQPGRYRAVCSIPGNLLNDESYRVRILMVRDSRVLFDADNVVMFEIKETTQRKGAWYGKWIGVVRPSLKWDTRHVGNSTP